MKKAKTKKVVEAKKEKEINLEDVDMRRLEAYLKERKITKVAHVPNGKYLWAHFVVEENVKQAISRALTNKDYNIHELCKLALISFLKVK